MVARRDAGTEAQHHKPPYGSEADWGWGASPSLAVVIAVVRSKEMVVAAVVVWMVVGIVVVGVVVVMVENTVGVVMVDPVIVVVVRGAITWRFVCLRHDHVSPSLSQSRQVFMEAAWKTAKRVSCEGSDVIE